MYKSIACLTIFLLMIFAFAPSCTDEVEKYINDESELCLDNFSIEGVSFSYENDTILGHASTNMDLSNLIAEFSSNGDVFVNNIPQISGVTENDFSSPVVYTISYPQKGWEKKYTVIIEIATEEATIILNRMNGFTAWPTTDLTILPSALVIIAKLLKAHSYNRHHALPNAKTKTEHKQKYARYKRERQHR